MKNFFRLPVIIGSLPVTLTNGTTADATQVMSDLNWIVNQVNANAAPLANTALTNANNNFTAVQSGQAATAAAHFPIAQQVQDRVFNTLSSTLGTNTLTARIAALPLGAYAVGQVFTFIPSQSNTQSATMNIDGLGSGVIKSQGAQLSSSQLLSGVTAMLRVNALTPMPVFDLLNPAGEVFLTNAIVANVSLNVIGTYFDGPTVQQGNSGLWFATGTVSVLDTTNVAAYHAKLWDGNTVAASVAFQVSAANRYTSATLSGLIRNPVGNIRISVADLGPGGTGLMLWNENGPARDSSITAIRIG